MATRTLQRTRPVALLNDLYSVTKDLAEEKPPCNMVLQVAADHPRYRHSSRTSRS